MLHERSHRTPRYQHYKARNSARVRIEDKPIYLGKYDSPESHTKDKRLIPDWLSQSQHFPHESAQNTLIELMASYLRHAREYYRQHGEPSRESRLIAEAMGHCDRSMTCHLSTTSLHVPSR